jgi:hypothetical protein
VLINALALKSNELTNVQVQSVDTFSAARTMELVVGYARKGGRGSGGRGSANSTTPIEASWIASQVLVEIAVSSISFPITTSWP